MAATGRHIAWHTVGKSYLSQIEAGKKTGSPRVLRALAAALRVDMDDLVVLD